ncbi:hypothetical protein D1AOALGA4SA_8411 [Olavius algarvensis Delta 1 endosymbiont]|nr:hypothetical protein D1AOALGA4SA_8411 [Olavius algarvensis Delta 1 endosymbiont]
MVNGNGKAWKSELSVMLSTNDEVTRNPLVFMGEIVKFYIEKLISYLLQNG